MFGVRRIGGAVLGVETDPCTGPANRPEVSGSHPDQENEHIDGPPPPSSCEFEDQCKRIATHKNNKPTPQANVTQTASGWDSDLGNMDDMDDMGDMDDIEDMDGRSVAAGQEAGG